MERYLYKELEEWSNSEGRRPLVLFGARQVGKTWLLREFGNRRYKNVAFVSFDRDDAAVQLMTTEKSAEKLLRGLSAITGVDIAPGKTIAKSHFFEQKCQICSFIITFGTYLNNLSNNDYLPMG